MTADGTVWRRLTPAELLTKRRQRKAERIRGELNRLTFERTEIQEDFRKAAELYARRLEALTKRAAKNAQQMAELRDKAVQED